MPRFIEEKPFVGCCRRGFAAIPRLQLAPVPMQQKGAAADAARLRLDQRLHHLDGDGGIECIAARPQHRGTRIAGQRMGTGHGPVRPDTLLDRPTRSPGSGLGLAWEFFLGLRCRRE